MNTGLASYYDLSYVCYDCVQSECATCADDTACTTCNVGFHLEEDAALGTVGTCVSDCGEKQYEYWPNGEANGGVCKNCLTNCMTCTDEITCDACDQNTGSSLYTTSDNSACVVSCPSEGRYYDNINTMHCSDCDISCAACSGPSNTDCLTCATDYNWGTHIDYTTTCVEDCATG